MAYFSNGTEGEVLDELCLKCIHGYDAEKDEERQGRACAVFMLQMMWNYGQHEREKHGTITESYRAGRVTTSRPIGEYTREAIVKKMALDELLPQYGDTLCAMFVQIEQAE